MDALPRVQQLMSGGAGILLLTAYLCSGQTGSFGPTRMIQIFRIDNLWEN